MNDTDINDNPTSRRDAALGYGGAAGIYLARGWKNLLPLPRGAKKNPPKGFSGHNGVTPSGADIEEWKTRYPDGNICIRLTDVVGIDVDDYEKKTGGKTFAEAQKRWGELPSGYRISSRPDPVPGIRLFRVPPDTVLAEKIEFEELGIGDIEILQHHHRYAVVWPSIHPSGVMYQWWRESDNTMLDTPPTPAELPELPAAWLEALREHPAHNDVEFGSGGGYNVRDALTDGDFSERVAARMTSAMSDLKREGACRHDVTRDHVLALLRFGKQGDTGVKEALAILGDLFVDAVAPDRAGGREEAEHEYREFIVSDRVAELLAEPDGPSHSLSDSTATVQPPTSTAMQPVARLQRILDRVADEVRSRGLVGEERLAQTLYLVLTSRLLDNQVSAGVKGHSASGKSYTVETVARLFPPEAYLEFTAMSERALVYSTEEYAHRTLIVYEVTALREGVEDDMTSYFVRSLLSEGRIVYPVTVRGKDGGFVTKTITKEGPTNLLFTTTKTRVHAENETRILSLSTDDSREQTARVLLELADEQHGDGDLEEWRDFQRWLADAEHRVTIPYARRLAQQVPPAAVRLRRDFGSLLALIRAHAVLHQASRERDAVGRIVATLDDYAVVRDLVADAIAEGVGATVSATVRETVDVVAELKSAEGVTARVIADELRLDKSTVSRRLRVAAEDGYIRNLEDKRGKPGRWVVGDPLPGSADLLPDPCNLATTCTPLDLSGCTVAPESDEKNDR